MGRTTRAAGSGATHFEALPSLFRICTAMGSTLELSPLLKLILRLTMAELKAQVGSILLFDKDSDQLKMLASRGMPREVVEKGYIPRKGSIAEWVIANNKPLLLNDIKDDKRFTSVVEKRTLRSSLCVPLRAKGKVIGTINITRTRGDHFTEEHLDTLVILAAQAAVSIENARLYEENLHAERLATVGRTVASISHCIKNMLTGLKGGVKIVDLGLRQKDWDMIAQGSEIARRNTDRIELLVLDMLDYSKERTPSRSIVDLPKMLGEICTNLSAIAQQTGVALSSRVEDACRTIYVDANQFYRTLLNLVTNAFDAVRDNRSEDGRVEIFAERVSADSPLVRSCLKHPAGLYDLIHVRDNGNGIPPEHLPCLFHPFFSSKGSKGTGLGLACARKFAREHGGDVIAQSKAGVGATFTVVLPVVAPPPAEADPQTAEVGTLEQR